MKIKEIYETLCDLKLTDSQMQFSRIWLGRSPRYYSHLVAVGRDPGIATLCGIKWRLDRLQFNSTAANKPLLELQHRIAQEIELRAITDRRRRN